MNTLYLVLELVFLFGGFLISRILSERSFRLLAPEQKLALLDSFPKLRIYSGIPLILFVFSFFALHRLPEHLFLTGYLTIWGLLFLWFAALHLYVNRRLKEFSLPPEYLKMHSRARHCAHLAWFGFFVCNTLNWFT